METLRLFRFECKMQMKSMTFIATVLLFAIFAVSQLMAVFYLPVMNERDIQALSTMAPDINQYVYTKNTDDKEIKALSITFLKNVLNDNTLEQNVVSELQYTIELLNNEAYTFDEVMTAVSEYEYAPAWLLSCKAQFSQRLVTLEEANHNIQSILGNTGYSPVLYENYVTYMQAIMSFLIFPLFLLVFIKDYRNGIFEIIYAQPISSSKYLLCKYLSIFIPLSVYLYLTGLILNLISASRFVMSGLEYQYTFFTPYFISYIFPALFFMSAVITVLMLLIKKAVAVLPIYILYVLFNVTPRTFAFGMSNADWIYLINPIIRLDHDIVFDPSVIVLNRVIYICLGIVLMIMACLLYKKIQRNMRGAITI